MGHRGYRGRRRPPEVVHPERNIRRGHSSIAIAPLINAGPLPLPNGHHFPVWKYRRVRERLQASSFRNELDFCLPPAVTDEQLLRVHTPEYLAKLKDGKLSRAEQRRIDFPWSPQMVQRHRRTARATLAASRAALQDGSGVQLAGGTHHGFPDRGEGFCVFNEVAVFHSQSSSRRSYREWYRDRPRCPSGQLNCSDLRE